MNSHPSRTPPRTADAVGGRRHSLVPAIPDPVTGTVKNDSNVGSVDISGTNPSVSASMEVEQQLTPPQVHSHSSSSSASSSSSSYSSLPLPAMGLPMMLPNDNSPPITSSTLSALPPPSSLPIPPSSLPMHPFPPYPLVHMEDSSSSSLPISAHSSVPIPFLSPPPFLPFNQLPFMAPSTLPSLLPPHNTALTAAGTAAVTGSTDSSSSSSVSNALPLLPDPSQLALPAGTSTSASMNMNMIPEHMVMFMAHQYAMSQMGLLSNPDAVVESDSLKPKKKKKYTAEEKVERAKERARLQQARKELKDQKEKEKAERKREAASRHRDHMFQRWREEREKAKYPCKECGLLCAHEMAQYQHFILAHHKFECPNPRCQHQIFPTGELLCTHLQKDHGEGKRFRCGFCGEGFKQRVHREVHEQRHVNARPFTCDFPGCGASFSRKSYYIQHRDVHSGQIPRCELCGKTFLHHMGLYRHIRKVHSARPFICVFCKHSFNNRGLCQHHLEVHHATALADRKQTVAAAVESGIDPLLLRKYEVQMQQLEQMQQQALSHARSLALAQIYNRHKLAAYQSPTAIAAQSQTQIAEPQPPASDSLGIAMALAGTASSLSVSASSSASSSFSASTAQSDANGTLSLSAHMSELLRQNFEENDNENDNEEPAEQHQYQYTDDEGTDAENENETENDPHAPDSSKRKSRAAAHLDVYGDEDSEATDEDADGDADADAASEAEADSQPGAQRSKADAGTGRLSPSSASREAVAVVASVLQSFEQHQFYPHSGKSATANIAVENSSPASSAESAADSAVGCLSSLSLQPPNSK